LRTRAVHAIEKVRGLNDKVETLQSLAVRYTGCYRVEDSLGSVETYFYLTCLNSEVRRNVNAGRIVRPIASADFWADGEKPFQVTVPPVRGDFEPGGDPR
jgi:hypothetical protein